MLVTGDEAMLLSEGEDYKDQPETHGTRRKATPSITSTVFRDLDSQLDSLCISCCTAYHRRNFQKSEVVPARPPHALM